MKDITILLGAVVLLLTNTAVMGLGCTCLHEPVGPVNDTDSGVYDAETTRSTCETACAHARTLGCSFAKPTDAGATCETVCGNVVRQHVIDWNLSCRSKAPTCTAIESCERR